jgi:hypothetical protein
MNKYQVVYMRMYCFTFLVREKDGRPRRAASLQVCALAH